MSELTSVLDALAVLDLDQLAGPELLDLTVELATAANRMQAVLCRTVRAADIDTLPVTAAALGQPGLDPDIAEVVQAYVERLGSVYRRVDRTELVWLLTCLAYPFIAGSPRVRDTDSSTGAR